ncbi:MAG: hypothetical protein H8E12_06275 [Rhodobacteraceae bacterium]|nr:hypothetical protein [Paracoccaceae bacterium]
MNILNDPKITLEEEMHVYKLVDDPQFQFTSSTTFLGQFFAPFEQDKIAQHLVTNVPRYQGRTPEELKEEWKLASDIGTAVHKELEDYLRIGKAPVHLKAVQGQKWIDQNIPPWLKVFPEVIIYSKELKLAGMIDALVFDSVLDEYVLIDWKTNKKISQDAYQGKVGTHEATKDIADCSFMRYSIQLSLYRYILETYYGITVKNSFIVHLKTDDAAQYKCPYLLKTITKMFGEAQHDKL